MLGDKKTYEIGFLLRDPDAEKEVLSLIFQHRGSVINKSQIKAIKLAYPVKKATSAYFGYVQFELLPENLEKLTHSLRLNQSIIRFIAITWLPVKKVSERKLRSKKISRIEAVPKSSLTNEILEEKLAALESE